MDVECGVCATWGRPNVCERGLGYTYAVAYFLPFICLSVYSSVYSHTTSLYLFLFFLFFLFFLLFSCHDVVCHVVACHVFLDAWLSTSCLATI